MKKSDFIYFEFFVNSCIYLQHTYLFWGVGVGERVSKFDKKILILKETQL